MSRSLRLMLEEFKFFTIGKLVILKCHNKIVWKLHLQYQSILKFVLSKGLCCPYCPNFFSKLISGMSYKLFQNLNQAYRIQEIVTYVYVCILRTLLRRTISPGRLVIFPPKSNVKQRDASVLRFDSE